MGTISKVGIKIWSYFYFLAHFGPPGHPKLLKKIKIVCNIKVDVWEEKCDIF